MIRHSRYDDWPKLDPLDCGDYFSPAPFICSGARLVRDTAQSACRSTTSISVRYSGPKKRGGFHPDYLVTWGDESERILVCFGCNELIYVNSSRSTSYDMETTRMKQLSGLLSAYAKNRPPRIR